MSIDGRILAVLKECDEINAENGDTRILGLEVEFMQRGHGYDPPKTVTLVVMKSEVDHESTI
jgi:hypothetical protein